MDVDDRADAIGSDLLLEYGELVITGIDAEMTARLFLHQGPVALPPRSPTPWRRHLSRRAVRARARRHASDPDDEQVAFDPLPSSAWELVDDLERLVARYPTTVRTPDAPPRVMERISA